MINLPRLNLFLGNDHAVTNSKFTVLSASFWYRRHFAENATALNTFQYFMHSFYLIRLSFVF